MKEGNVLFNDALNTFCLQLYGVRYNYGKDHSDNKKGNLLSPHGLLFPISSKGSFMCITHSLCYTSRVALAGTRNNSMSPPWWIDLMTHHTMSERSYHRPTSHCFGEKQSQQLTSRSWSCAVPSCLTLNDLKLWTHQSFVQKNRVPPPPHSEVRKT